MVIEIGIAAYSGDPPPKAVSKVSKLVEYFVEICRDVLNDVVFLVGGYEGLMRFFIDKVLDHRLRVVLIPPVEQEDKRFPEEAIVIKTGVTFIVRSSILVHSSDILLALGGGVGTLEEVITAHNEGKPVYVLIDTDLPTDTLKLLPERIDLRTSNPVKLYSDPEKLAVDLCSELKLLKSRYRA